MFGNNELIKEALTDEGFNNLLNEVAKRSNAGEQVLYDYFDGGQVRELIEKEIDDIASNKRKKYNKGGIPNMKFEILMSGVYSELASKPTAKRCEELKEMVIKG
jgi:predicted nucleotidyltransferase